MIADAKPRSTITLPEHPGWHVRFTDPARDPKGRVHAEVARYEVRDWMARKPVRIVGPGEGGALAIHHVTGPCRDAVTAMRSAKRWLKAWGRA